MDADSGHAERRILSMAGACAAGARGALAASESGRSSRKKPLPPPPPPAPAPEPGTVLGRRASGRRRWTRKSVIAWCRSSIAPRAATCWRVSAASAASSPRSSASSCSPCTSATTWNWARHVIASALPAWPSARASCIRTANCDQPRSRVFGPLNGLATHDPAFGMEAVWIEPSMREHAQSPGYTVVDAATVIATHLSHLIQTHAHELFGHEEAEQLLKSLAEDLAEAGRRTRAEGAAARHRRARHAGPAGRARADPQRPRHRRSAGGSRSAHAGHAEAHRARSGLPWVGRSSRTSSASPKSCPSSHLSQISSAYCQTDSQIRPQVRVSSQGWQTACNEVYRRRRASRTWRRTGGAAGASGAAQRPWRGSSA